MTQGDTGWIFELREYRLRSDAAQAYLRRFADWVVPRLRDCGFAIQDAWVADAVEPGVTSFVWLLRWHDREERDRAFARLAATDGWGNYKSDVSSMVIEARSRIMSRVVLDP